MVFSGIRILLISLFLILFSSPVLAAPDIDIDRDGYSDVFFININSDKSLSWYRITTGASGSPVSGGVSMGTNGDMLAPGAWFDTSRNHLGVVSLKNNEIIWKVRDDNGAIQKISFGNKGNMVLSGGDFNGNGLLDGVIASKNGIVIVRTEIFAQLLGRASSDFELTFGSAVGSSGRLMFLSPEGMGDNVAFLVRKKNIKGRYKYIIYRKDLFNRTTKIRLRGYENGKFRDAFPVESPDGSDYVGIVTKNKGKLKVTVMSQNRNKVSQHLFKTGTFAMSGNYLSDPGHEIAVKTSSGLVVINPTTKRKVLFAIPAGIPADHVNFNRFGKSSKNSGGGGGGGNDGGGGGGGDGIDSVCSSTSSSLPRGVLWKPDSDVSDNRGGKPVLLFQGSHKPGGSNVNVYATNGTKVCNFTYKAPNEHGINGGSDHYYSGWHGGCSKTGGQIASAARQASGNGKVYFKGRGGKCYGPIDPDHRHGSIG